MNINTVHRESSGMAFLKKSRRCFLFTTIFIFLHFCADAQQVRPNWVDDFKGNSGISSTTGVAIDQQNNIYITGYFLGTVDFDPSSGVKNLTSAGQTDVFIGKYKQDGTLIWVESIGGTGGEEPYNIVVDKDGNVSIAGTYFSSTLNADPGSGVYDLYGDGAENGFLIHLNTNGGFLWAHSLEASPIGGGEGNYLSVATDGQDNVLALAIVPAKVPIGDSTNNFQTNQLIKYNPSGQVIWSLNFQDPSPTPTGHTSLMSIAADNQNNVVVSGTFSHTINFNPLGADFNLTTADNFSYFVAKYSSAGYLNWVNPIYSPKATSQSVYPVVCIDKQNNIDFSSIFYPSIILGSTTLNTTGSGINECIAKYSPAGVLQFAKAFGEANNDFSSLFNQSGIADDKNNNIYIAGYFTGSINFDTNGGTAGNLIAKGYQDFYVAKYDSLGNYIYAFNAGSPNCGNTYSYTLAIDTNNNIDVGGSFCSTVNFDPSGCSPLSETATSAADPFIAQYASDALANNVITPPTVTSFCTNGTPGAITGSLPTGGSGTYTYQWLSSADSVTFADINGATAQNYTPPTITATTYYERMVSSDTCTVPTVSNIIGLHVLPALAAPVVTVASTTSSSVIFTWPAVPGATSYQVSTNGGQSFTTVNALADTVKNLQSGQSVTISVQAAGIIPCQLSATATAKGSIAVTDIVFVANAFTPNGDGRDDILHVKGDNIQSLKFSIYDQWGELLFSTTSQQNGWDGTYKGTKEPVGVYVYYVEAVMNDGTNVKKKGTVTLLK